MRYTSERTACFTMLDMFSFPHRVAGSLVVVAIVAVTGVAALESKTTYTQSENSVSQTLAFSPSALQAGKRSFPSRKDTGNASEHSTQSDDSVVISHETIQSKPQPHTPDPTFGNESPAPDQEQSWNALYHDSDTTVPSSITPAKKTAARAFTAESCEKDRASFALYGDPRAQAIRLERDLRGSDPQAAALLRRIACVPQPTWIVGGDVSRIRSEVEERMQGAAASDKTPVFVIYTSPDSTTATWHVSITGGSYHEFIAEIARGIGHYGAWVVLEPDAVPIASQYNSIEYAKRMAEFRESIALFTEYAPNTRVYIDAGHSSWIVPTRKAELLRDAGIAQAHGFSLNVSNYQTTEANIAYGRQLSDLIGNKPFIIDTSRNGVGPAPDNEWCNAEGRALGQLPDLSPNIARVDALLRIKPPGESDGFCNGGPQAGKFWLDYALALVKNSLR